MNIARYLVREILLESIFIFRNFLRRSITNLIFNRARVITKAEKTSGKILFIRFDSKYGDSIVSQFALEKIKKELNSEIYVLTKNKQSMDFFSEIVDCFIICKNPRRMSQLFNSYKEISSIHFDHVIHLDKNIKDRELIFLRYVKSNSVITADFRIKFANKYLLQKGEVVHFRKRCINLLNVLNIHTSPNDSTQLKIPDLYTKKLKRSTKSLGKIIYFNPYGSGSKRKLSTIKINEIKSSVEKIFPNFSIIIQSKKHGNFSIKNVNDGTFIFKTNTFNDILALIDISIFIISVDTATSHAATALNKSSIILYNPDKENYIEWNADSEKSIPIFSKKSTATKFPNIGNFNNLDFHLALKSVKKYE